jgi:LDH2 family malate/lactate/ureidoglycolate dehydrogenase
MTERLRDGIPIDDTTWKEIEAAGEAVGMPKSEIDALLGN